MAQLEIRDLTVDFGGFRAVDGLNLNVEKGELLCLLGPNGAGKSTTLDLICGKTQPTSGKVVFDGATITNLPEFKRARHGVGRKFQIPSVFKRLTVRENLELARSQRPGVWANITRILAKPSEALEKIMETVGLTDQRHVLAENLSHGQTQWLEIAMLLSQDCKLLLMDEPTAGMTASETQRTAAILEKLHGERTIVVVEHDMQFVRKVARRITVLHQGSVLAEGSIKDIESNPEVRSAYLGH
ncbi:ABC transporter, nucleotide binding/ATPase protein [Fulvimarina pelagi HTCC2506]|uniref:ABC transporter, nucleotide binding/ATPase protein n=2 Tax=Fulvimarina pelagi TaxID=217511 RepID=Q0FY86_9HYPH|nr:urea ABC transporter ATP-binding protein UrtD [Fulvimarina pelagi]EAU39856.1 ABC transporter, nucleotide binding/ATPase protein [Fulvimarina pelagi HTCC2506]